MVKGTAERQHLIHNGGSRQLTRATSMEVVEAGRKKSDGARLKEDGLEENDISAPAGPSVVDSFGIGAMIGPQAKPPALTIAALSEWVGASEPAPGALFVLKLQPGGAAALSGMVREGDELIAVDRQKVADLRSQEVSELLQGAQGSLVKLRLRRHELTFDVCLQREAPRQPPPMRTTLTLNPPPPREDGATEILEKFYGGTQFTCFIGTRLQMLTYC